jgi:phage FluMu gp28-like protein
MSVVEHAFTSQSVSRLALRLHQLIRDHALALPDDEELLAELANVRLREMSPGVYRLDHDPDKHDDRAIALALGAVALVDWGPGESVEVFFDPESGEFVDEEPVPRRISKY